MKSILSYILMNPRTILAALAASIAINVGLAGAVFVKDTEADAQRTRAVAAEATVASQTAAAQAIAEAGKLRAETAERAMRSAQEAGRADRAAAQRYLNLPLPAPADRCDAARALVDEAVVEARS